MTKFKLQQKAAGRAGPSGMTTFNVLDDTGATRGTISVPSSESDSLIKCWAGKFEAAKPTGPSAMARVLMAKRTARKPSTVAQAMLRGS